MVSWVSSSPATTLGALGEPTVERFRYLSTVHDDGWGAAWVGPDEVLRTHRSVAPAHADPDFDVFVRETRARACFLHARLGTPGYGEGAVNVHPFEAEGTAFAHNGAILPTDLISGLLPPGREPRSQTDSEIYFLALLDRLAREDGRLDRAARDVIRDAGRLGLRASSMNAFLLDPTALSVVSHFDPSAGTGHVQVWPDEPGVTWPAYHPMLHLDEDGTAAVASSGIVAETGGWTVLPNNCVWTADLATVTVVQTAITGVDGPARAAS